MKLDVIDLLDENNLDYDVFFHNVDSKLMIDFNRDEIIENSEWIDEVLFTIPYIEKALEKHNKIIITEEEIVKIESIKKVTVDSVKHLSKHTNLVNQFDEETGDVVPERLLNAYREENFITYENRFLYTLINLIRDFIIVRNRNIEKGLTNKSKNAQVAVYEATTKIRKENIKVKMEYESRITEGEDQEERLELKLAKIERQLSILMSTEIYQLIQTKRAPLVKPPLRMTNVLLKNVNYQYCVKLWNYLNSHFDLKNNKEKSKKNLEEKGLSKRMVDETFLLNYAVLNYINMKKTGKKPEGRKAVDKKTQQELTDNLIREIIRINPDIARDQLKNMVVEKYIQIQKSIEASLKPIEEKFNLAINEYVKKFDEAGLK